MFVYLGCKINFFCLTFGLYVKVITFYEMTNVWMQIIDVVNEYVLLRIDF